MKKSVTKLQDLIPKMDLDLYQTVHQPEIGIFGFNKNGLCLFVNETAVSMLGYSKARSIIGKNVNKFFHHNSENGNKSANVKWGINTEGELRKNGVITRYDKSISTVNSWVYSLNENSAGICYLLGIKSNKASSISESTRKLVVDRFNSLLDTTQLVLWEFDILSEHFTFISPQVVNMFGYSLTSWYSKAFWEEHITAIDNQNFIEQCRKLSGEQKNFTIESRMQHENGSVVYVRTYISVTKTALGVNILRGVFVDITADKVKENKLILSDIAFEASTAMIITDSQANIVKVNREFSQLCGFSAEELVGKNASFFRSDNHDTHFYEALWRDLVKRSRWQGKIFNKRKSGETHADWVVITAVKDIEGKVSHYIGVYSDMTERRAVQDQIRYQENYDTITSLPNRSHLISSLKQAIKDSAKSKLFGSLLVFDLDDFKYINDSLGHQWGDKLLKQVATRLSAKISHGDVLARIGGDEFALLMPAVAIDISSVEVRIKQCALNFKNAFSQSFTINEQEIFLTISIGIATFPSDCDNAHDILRKADTAMNKAKESGKNRFCMFYPSMYDEMESQMTIRNELTEALSHGQLMLYLQPVFDCSRNLVSAEALLRWQHPIKGWIPPVDFIPIAEKTGLILPLGEWVFKSACHLLKRWLKGGNAPINKLAINVSVHQFSNPAFLIMVEENIIDLNIPAGMLEFELTEEVLVGDIEATANIFKKIKALGISISIDDFGTGYSSLSYIKKLPIDKLKIDRSFVMDTPEDKNDAAIVKLIVSMASILGILVTAEGVETEEQVEFLNELNCDFMQGYFFSWPLPINEFEVFAGNLNDPD